MPSSAEVELQPADRFDWERIVRRCRLHRDTKLVGYTLAQYGDQDGTRIRPGVPLVARDCVMSTRTVERHVRTLRDLGLLEQVRRGGGPGGGSSEYRLTVPSDLPERVEMAGPDEAAAPRDSRHSNGASPPVDNGPSGDTPMARDEAPDGSELATPQGELATDRALTRDTDPLLTCSNAVDQKTNHIPTKTSPQVSTSPAAATAEQRDPFPALGETAARPAVQAAFWPSPAPDPEERPCTPGELRTRIQAARARDRPAS